MLSWASILSLARQSDGRHWLSDHVDGPLAQRDHVQASIGAACDIGDHAEVLSGREALAVAFIELVFVLIDAILQFGIGKGEMLAAFVEFELEQIASVEEGAGSADEQAA